MRACVCVRVSALQHIFCKEKLLSVPVRSRFDPESTMRMYFCFGIFVFFFGVYDCINKLAYIQQRAVAIRDGTVAITLRPRKHSAKPFLFAAVMHVLCVFKSKNFRKNILMKKEE